MTYMESFDEYNVRGKIYKFKNFDKIENVNDAYFIGYMSADGGFLKGQKSNSELCYPSMSLTSIDHYIVEAFQNRYCPDTKIQYRQPRSSKKVKANNPTAELDFPKGMKETFNKFGIFDYKPNRTMVGIPRDYYSTYVLGIIDADGCFVVRERRDCRTPRLNVHIVSSAIKILENVQRILQLELNISSSIYQRKSSDCFELRINDTENSIKFGKWIYSRCPLNYNFKKKKIFENYINSINK